MLVRLPAASARHSTRTVLAHIKPLKMNTLTLAPRWSKVCPDEVADQLVLAGSDREALAKSGVEFARELGFVARQCRDDFRHDPNAQRHSSCGERESHENERRRCPSQTLHSFPSHAAKPGE
jgi:hypothetical protein